MCDSEGDGVGLDGDAHGNVVPSSSSEANPGGVTIASTSEGPDRSFLVTGSLPKSNVR